MARRQFRTRRLFSPASAGLVHSGLRLLRAGAQPHRDVLVERFVLPASALVAAPIPKVASRTIQAMFGQIGGGRQVICSPDQLMRDHAGSFVFSFVRNPWSRVHSCWKDKIADAVTPGKLMILSRYRGLRPFMPFAEFVEWLASDEGRDELADRHWLSQVRHLETEAGQGICDFVGRIEAFDEGLSQIEAATGVALPRIAAQNVTPGGSGGYAEAYDDHLRALVARRYGEDIECFGYRFG